MSDVTSCKLGLVNIEVFDFNDIEVLNAEDEFSFVGASIGNNIENTKELRVMNY